MVQSASDLHEMHRVRLYSEQNPQRFPNILEKENNNIEMPQRSKRSLLIRRCSAVAISHTCAWNESAFYTYARLHQPWSSGSSQGIGAWPRDAVILRFGHPMR